jgi:hypothetical protein
MGVQTIGFRKIGLRSSVIGGSEINWAAQPEVLFYGLYSEISGGRMPNKVLGATDYLTVTGVAGSENYQCPNTAAYIAADTDYIWFKTDASQRTTTTAELVGYDLPRTPVKYDDTSPYQIRAIMILKAGMNFSTVVYNKLYWDFWLPILRDNVINRYGRIKENRLGQSLWTPEEIGDADALALFARMDVQPTQALKDLITTTIVGLKADGVWTKGDALYVRGVHDVQASRLNWIKNLHYSTYVGSPTFVPKVGIRGDGTNHSINLNFIPKTQAVKMGLEDLSIMIMLTEISGTAGRYPFGAVVASTSSIRVNHITLPNSCRGYINSSTYISHGITANTYLGINRLGITDRIYSNGAYAGITADHASFAEQPGITLMELAYNSVGSPTAKYPGLIAVSWYGGSLTDAQHLALYTRIKYFYDHVGATF